MEKRKIVKIKKLATSVCPGASSGIGVMIGNVLSQPQDSEEQTTLAQTSFHTAQPNPQLAAQSVPQPEPQPIATVVSEPLREGEVQVLNYETVTHHDGSQMDMAVVNVDHQPVLAVDGNQDGIVDVIVVDANMDGVLGNGEIVDVTSENISMGPFGMESETLANGVIGEGPDYVNDADVDDYMA